MKKPLCIIATILLLGCQANTEQNVTKKIDCNKKIILSSHFTEIPLPENTCPLMQANTNATTEQKFTIPLSYKDAITEIKALLQENRYTVSEHPETTISTQKTWSAQVQAETQTQTIYTFIISNQNPVSFEVTNENAFLTIQEHTSGG